MKPWERHQATAASAPVKGTRPWEKYAAASPEAAPVRREQIARPAPAPGFFDRFRANFQNDFRNNLLGSTAENIAARVLEEDRVYGDAARQAYVDDLREEQAAFDRMPSFMEAETLGEKVLGGGAALLGSLAGGSASPEAAVGPAGAVGRTVTRRLADAAWKQAAVEGAIDPAVQGIQIDTGTRDEYDPVQTVMAAALGAGIGAGGRAGVEAINAAPELGNALRNFIGSVKNKAPEDVTPEDLTPEIQAAVIEDPDLAALVEANMPAARTGPVDPRETEALASRLGDRLAARRSAEADRGQFEPEPIIVDPVRSDVPVRDGRLPKREAENLTKEIQRRRDMQDGIEAGNIDPAFDPRVPREPVPEVIALGERVRSATGDDQVLTPNRATEPGTQAGFDRFAGPEDRGVLRLPAPGQESRRIAMTDREIAQAQRYRDSGQRNQAEPPDTLIAGQEGTTLPRDRDGALQDRQATQAFRSAERQRGRIEGDSTRDTQPAGLTRGPEPEEIAIHRSEEGDFPVKIVGRGDKPTDVLVQRYNPKTGEPTPGSEPYPVFFANLKTAKFEPEPRRAQDFEVRTQTNQPAPERPRFADDPVSRIDPQTFRATGPDPNADFPGAGEGRSPITDPPDPLPEGPGFRESAKAEDIAREFRAREKARQEYEARAEREAREQGGAKQQEWDNYQSQRRRQEEKYKNAKTSNTPKGKASDGGYEVDEDGFIFSDAGGPIKFGDPLQAGRWIVKNNKDARPGTTWEPANHPSGDGTTVREYDATGDAKNQGANNDGKSKQQGAGEQDQPNGSDRDRDKSSERSGPNDGSGRADDTGGAEANRGDGADRNVDTPSRDQGPERNRDAGSGNRDTEGNAEESAREKEQSAVNRSARLYSNPFADPDLIADFFKDIYGFTSSGLKFFLRSTSSLVGLGKAGPLRALARSVFFTTEARIRAVGYIYDSPTARKVADMWHSEAGHGNNAGRTYDEAVNWRREQRFNEIARIMDPFEKRADDAAAQITKLVRNPRLKRPKSKIGEAADKIEKLLKEELAYLREAGVEVGEVKHGYLPRVVDESKIFLDPDGFKDAATRTFMKMGLGRQEAEKGASEWLDRIMGWREDLNDFVTIAGSHSPNLTKGRKLPEWADKQGSPLADYYISDVRDLLGQYVSSGTRRAEWARRMGPKLEKWNELKAQMRKEGVDQEGIDEIVSNISTLAGQGQNLHSKRWNNAVGWLQVWNTLGLLERATLSSLQEIIMPAVRAGDAAAAFQSTVDTFKDLFLKLHKSGTDVERREFAEDLGFIVSSHSSSMNAMRWAEFEPMTKMQSKVMDVYFRRIGLEQLTRATRTAAVATGRRFVRRLIRDHENGRTAKATNLYLSELGISEDMVPDMAKWLKSHNYMPSADVVKNSGKLGEAYQTALGRFIDQSIMRPSTATRPQWAVHPIGRMIFQLQGFLYAFHKNVVGRSYSLGKKALTEKDLTVAERIAFLGPASGAAMLLPMALAIGEVRDAVFGDPVRREQETGQEKALKAISRSGLFGAFDPYVNLITGARYNRSMAQSLIGPLLGRLSDTGDTTLRSMVRNSDNTNTQERALVKSIYDMGIEPTINMMLTKYGLGFAPAAVTQAAGAGWTRETFITFFAGPPDARRGGPGKSERGFQGFEGGFDSGFGGGFGG